MLLRYPLRKIITNRRIFVTALTATIIVFSVTVTLLNDFNNNSVAKKVNGLAKKFGVVIDSNFRTGYWEQAKKTAAYSEYRTLYVSLTGEEAPYDASFLEAEQAGAYLQQIIITRGISPSIEQQRALQNFAELLRDYRQVCNLNGEADLESTFFLLPESHKKTAETIWQTCTSIFLIFCLVIVFFEPLYGNSTEVIRTSKAFRVVLRKQNIVFFLLLLVVNILIVTVPLIVCFYTSESNLFSSIPFSAFQNGMSDVPCIFSWLTFKWYFFLLPVLSLCLGVFELLLSRIILYIARNDLRALILTVFFCAILLFISFVLKSKNAEKFNYLPFSSLLEPDIIFTVLWSPLFLFSMLTVLFAAEVVLRRKLKGIHRD